MGSEWGDVYSDREHLMSCIAGLKEGLVGLGYNPSEVDYIAQKYAGGKISELPLNNLQKVQKALQNHLEMVRKCIDIK